MAAPAFNNAVSIKFSDDTSQAYNAGTGTGRILIVGVAVDDATDNITGITYNGVALTNVDKEVSDGLSASVELWYLIDPAAGSNTLAINASASDTYVAIVSYVSGAKLINPIGKTASTIGDSTTAAVSFTPTMADSLIFCMVANDATDAMAGNNSCTELLEDLNGLRGGIYYKTSTSTASHTVGATGGDDDWAIIGLEIKPQTYVILNQVVTTLTPSDGTLKGNASWVNAGAGVSYIQLTAASATQTGQYELNETLTDYFSAEFDIYSGGGTGADGIWFYWGDSSTPSTEDATNSGYHVVFDEYEDKVFLSFNGSELASYSINTLDNSTWRSVRIIKNVNNILVYLDGTLIIAYTDTTRTLGSNLYGWGARTGGSTNSHRIKNLVVTTGANTVEQEGFRFRNDDGSETTATWIANQDTDIDLGIDEAFRLRTLLNTTGDVEPQTYKLQYQINSGGYRDVLAAEVISSTNLATGGTATASHENLPSEGVDKLFDGNASSKWLAFNTTPWVQYQFASSVTHLVVKYALTSGNDDDTRDPKDWTLQGSNDGSSWTTVDTVSGETFASRGLRKEYTCDTPGTTAYEYFRLNVVANNGSGSITQLAELQFYENTPEYVLLKASANITASGENTTYQLTAPSGKSTSDFDAGRLQDDENPTDSITVSTDDYTEVEWSLELKNTAVDDVIDFRVLQGTLVLDTYTQTPTITVTISGTATNSSRPAKITGSNTSNSTRSAKTTGTATASSARVGKITGTLTTSSARASKITGEATTNATRSAKVTGSQTTNSTRSANVTGTATANSVRSGKITGEATANSESSGKITGSSSSNSSRSAYIRGMDTTFNDRSAKIVGALGADSARLAKITGTLGDNSTRSAKITGSQTTNSARSAKITGSASANSARSAKITGTATTNSARSAKVVGTLGANSNRLSKITGTATTNSTRSAKITGQIFTASIRSAKIQGYDTTNSTRSAKVTGLLAVDVNSERSAKVTGVLRSESTRGAKIVGTSSSWNSQTPEDWYNENEQTPTSKNVVDWYDEDPQTPTLKNESDWFNKY